jgi:hypothetical protein
MISGVDMCTRDAVMILLVLLLSCASYTINSLLLLCMPCYLLTGAHLLVLVM